VDRPDKKGGTSGDTDARDDQIIALNVYRAPDPASYGDDSHKVTIEDSVETAHPSPLG
jgi:hypothetical protein